MNWYATYPKILDDIFILSKKIHNQTHISAVEAKMFVLDVYILGVFGKRFVIQFRMFHFVFPYVLFW